MRHDEIVSRNSVLACHLAPSDGPKGRSRLFSLGDYSPAIGQSSQGGSAYSTLQFNGFVLNYENLQPLTPFPAALSAYCPHLRCREIRAMNRLSVMGELTASLADEIAQPVATALNNARAAIRFLDRSPPDLSEVREALECIVADADRARDLIDRVRDQFKTVPRKDLFDANKAIDDVTARGAK